MPTAALTGRPPTRRPFPLRGDFLPVPYGKGRGPSRVLHRDGRRRGLREGRGVTESPLRGGTVLTGVLTGRATGRQGPYEEGRSLREGPVPLREGPGSLMGPSQRRTTKRLTGRQGSPLRGGTVLTGRAGPYGKGRGPLRGDRLTGRPLTGRLLTRRPLTNYRKAYGKLRGGTLPELGGNFRLCAVDQKRPFFS